MAYRFGFEGQIKSVRCQDGQVTPPGCGWGQLLGNLCRCTSYCIFGRGCAVHLGPGAAGAAGVRDGKKKLHW